MTCGYDLMSFFVAAETIRFYFPFTLCSLEMPKRRLPALANKGIFLKHFQVNQTKMNGSILLLKYYPNFLLFLRQVNPSGITLALISISLI